MASTLTCTHSSHRWSVSASHHRRPHRSVIVGIGVEVTYEVIAAAALLRKYAPALRVRVVNVTDLMILAAGGTHPHALKDGDFDALFTRDRAVHINFHGYPIEVKGLLFGRPNLDRVTLEGYREEGTTTSPFDVSSLFIPYRRTNNGGLSSSDDARQLYIAISRRRCGRARWLQAQSKGLRGRDRTCGTIYAHGAEGPRIHS